MGSRQTKITSDFFKISKNQSLDSFNTKSIFFLKLKQTHPKPSKILLQNLSFPKLRGFCIMKKNEPQNHPFPSKHAKEA